MPIKDPIPRRFDTLAVDETGLDDFLASAGPRDVPPAQVNQVNQAKLAQTPAAQAFADLDSTPATPAASSQIGLQFALIEPEEVGEVILVIPANDDGQHYVVDAEVLTGLRGEIQAWLALLRQQGQMVTELLPLSVRDQSSRTIVSQLLGEAYRAPSRSWMTTLPTGRQIVIAPAHVVNTIGFEGICRVAHKTAILAAQAAGEPYNARALQQYRTSGPVEMA